VNAMAERGTGTIGARDAGMIAERDAGTWADALLAAAIFAIDPARCGGVALRASSGPVRDRWMQALALSLSGSLSVRRLPSGITDARLLGGLDLAATLRAGRPIVERGLLADADGGVLLVPSAERMESALAARLAAVMDAGEVALERDGLAARMPARFGLVLFDEGLATDERVPAALLDRVAFHLDLSMLRANVRSSEPPSPAQVLAARDRYRSVHVDETITTALVAAAAALGIDSLRAVLLALHVARCAAALAGRNDATEDDATLAARLVFAARATRMPTAESEEPREDPPDAPDDGNDSEDERDAPSDGPLADRVVESAKAAMPPGLLAMLMAGGVPRARSSGKSGAQRRGGARGRPLAARRGELRPGVRLNVIETLRAAAPWQPLRRRERGFEDANARIAVRKAATNTRIDVRKDDFRVTRFRSRTATTTIFVVDASGSAALNRLAEAKGAVELLLADCYVRRDQVALIAFRGNAAELILTPTRSLARAKRGLAALPGGGGTPLACGIDAALALADGVRRRGASPIVVLLTDGRANVARDASPGRARALEDALASSRRVREDGLPALVVDVSPQPQDNARRVAEAMGAGYLPLPYADARALSRAAQATAAGA
jgi:magnesium chelatase subunit D